MGTGNGARFDERGGIHFGGYEESNRGSFGVTKSRIVGVLPLMSPVLSPRSAPATASCFPRHALPRRHSVLHRSAPSGHHPRLGRTILCHHDGGTLWIILAAGSQQVRILRVLMPHEGCYMFYIIKIIPRCALAQPSQLPLLPAPMTPALHCSPRLLHTILTVCDSLILSTTQAARRW